ncbi:hypothetical protein [Streptomyces sp. NRRL F-5135]|uniref:hypothetical protein n=1 Tax=Streptomyces sp. NRRL F-5135 TaxID=1463858 RepID=UPI0004C9C0AC|nr:hypothetical protein [Streptomyces sp. NRRL F-5135]
MNDSMTGQAGPPVQALPGGEAELRLVVRLEWEDVAALGQEASRLAAQLKRAVSLDEAASHRLRSRTTHRAKPAQDWPVTSASSTGSAAAPAATAPPAVTAAPPQAAAPAGVSSLAARTPGEHARQAIEKINGTAGAPHTGGQTSA